MNPSLGVIRSNEGQVNAVASLFKLIKLTSLSY